MTIINYYYICLIKKTKMKKILLTLLCLPSLVFSQVNYTVTVNTPDSWQGNLFFQRGGTPQKLVKIIDPSITEIYSQNLGMKGWDFKVNYNNKISYFDRSSMGWFIMDSLQNEIDSVYCLNGYTADNHDFLALANGNYVLFAYDEQPYAMDTVVIGGNPNATVEGLIIQELDANHNLIFEWKSWDHFHVTDNAYMSPWTGANLPFIHANAIDIDFDGHFLISCRGLDEITKIHRTSGEIIWRWGGTQNEFTFVDDYPFTHQHSIRSLGNSRYLLYDNGNYSAQYTGTINISRAVEYELDTNLMEATKVWEFVHPDSLYTPSIGGAQRLPNGNTLINFGNLQWLNTGSIVTEVDSNNQIVFQLEYDDGGNLYRAQKFDWFFYTLTLGCTESLACNYDASATLDNSSCGYNTSSYDTLSVNTSIVWNGITLSASGDYSITLINFAGCDSIANLKLTINYNCSDSLEVTDVIIDTTNSSISISIFSDFSFGLWYPHVAFTIDANGDTVHFGNLYYFMANSGTTWYNYFSINTNTPQFPLSIYFLYGDSTCILSYNPSVTSIIQNTNTDVKEIIKITDILGRESKGTKNKPLFYIYDNGTVEKRIIVE